VEVAAYGTGVEVVAGNGVKVVSDETDVDFPFKEVAAVGAEGDARFFWQI
jgi:hypothetical protein